MNSSPWGTHSFLRGLHAHVMPQVVFPAYQREELIHILTQVARGAGLCMPGGQDGSVQLGAAVTCITQHVTPVTLAKGETQYVALVTQRVICYQLCCLLSSCPGPTP
jgi:hypothetical protein